MKLLSIFFVLSASLLAQNADGDLRLNQIQVIGTHNSYSLPADPRVFELMMPRIQPMLDGMIKRMTPEMAARMKEEHPNPLTADLRSALDYIHPPIEAQLRAGIRNLEIDIYADPKGGLFAEPVAYKELRAKGVKDLAPLYTDSLREPGLKVFHMAEMDFRSQCPTFRNCLMLLKQWSTANPSHSPVFIMLETKTPGLEMAIPGAAKVLPFDAATYAEMDRSIAEIIGREHVFAPDDLRGTYKTLEEATLAKNWPKLSASRGKFIFVMLAPGPAAAPYLEGRPNLEGRMAFVDSQPGQQHAAFLLIDNALSDPKRIPEMVKKGYLVRSRADIDTYEGRQNETRRRDKTLESGAQILSTDYVLAPNIFGNTYQVAPFSGGYRCNPVLAGCKP